MTAAELTDAGIRLLRVQAGALELMTAVLDDWTIPPGDVRAMTTTLPGPERAAARKLLGLLERPARTAR